MWITCGQQTRIKLGKRIKTYYLSVVNMTKQKQNQMQEELKKTLEGVKQMLDIIHNLPDMQLLYVAMALNCIHELLHKCEKEIETNLTTTNN